ncbi:hypothetical protein BJ165DRAFT_1419358 [Panaeolus papilionaceus]|nr:hypothetical protein BJ165DRAFT_1419358 [Panaeolus papilionaceus]
MSQRTSIIPSKLRLVNNTAVRDATRTRLPDLSPEVDHYINYVETTAARMPAVALPPLTEDDPHLPPFMWRWLNEGIASGHIPPQQGASCITNGVSPRKRKRLATGPRNVSQKRVRTAKTQPHSAMAPNVPSITNAAQGSLNGRPDSRGRSETPGQTWAPAATQPPLPLNHRASVHPATLLPLHRPLVPMHWVNLQQRPNVLATAAPGTSTMPWSLPSNQRTPRRI